MDNVVSLHSNKLKEEEDLDKQTRDLGLSLLQALFAGRVDSDKAADLIIQKASVDEVSDFNLGVTKLFQKLIERQHPEVSEAEIVPFEDDPIRFVLWSVIASSLSPQFTSQEIASTIRNKADEDVKRYMSNLRQSYRHFLST